MAYREVTRVDIQEIIRRWQRGEGYRRIASGTGLSRNTVRKYLAAAKAEGIAQDGAVPTDDQLSRLAVIGQAGPRQAETPSEDLLAPWADQIYQWLTGDRPLVTRIHELRRTGLTFNRVAISEGGVLAAPATGIIEALIEAGRGASETLARSFPHSVLASVAGGELVNGAFFTPQWVVDTWYTVNPRSPERLNRYSGNWKTLPEYTLALSGNSSGRIVVALFLPAGSDAEAAEQELATRWGSQQYDPSGPLTEEEFVPLGQACSPFTTRITEHARYSVLVGSCPVVGNGDSSVWTWLFSTRQLEFLVPDLGDLR